MAINSAIYSNVYNYYRSELTPRSSSRFDSHKKKDLQDVYKSIVNISKDEPVFLLDRSKELEDYTIHMKENALAFSNNVSSISGSADGELFTGQTAYSSDPDAVEVTGFAQKAADQAAEQTSDSDAPVEASNTQYELKVKQLAGCQENTGRFLDKIDSDLPGGNYSFDVSTATSTYELQFTIADGDSNYDIQRRMARLINNFNLGLNAEVVENSNAESALVIRSNSSGDRDSAGGHFIISDDNTSQQAGIVDYFGIGEVTSRGQDAIYEVYGEERTSSVNEISLDGVFNVSLKETTPDGKPVTIGFKPDYEAVKDNIISLAGSYNDFLRATAEYVDVQPRTNLFVADMKNNSRFYTSSLEDMGVTQNDDGTLSVDADKLSEALKNEDRTEDLDTLKNFTKFALRKAKGIQLNPMDYVDKRIVAYKNPTTAHYANPYVTSAYSGMLFNSYM
ncbi:MAG: flagellar filament capping protein FliD [Lachnospiraceae bacterium]|nr:flagellar filament capping protein FliD [Lachnospiraceae bacterium]